jgi:hypothetical protein
MTPDRSVCSLNLEMKTPSQAWMLKRLLFPRDAAAQDYTLDLMNRQAGQCALTGLEMLMEDEPGECGGAPDGASCATCNRARKEGTVAIYVSRMSPEPMRLLNCSWILNDMLFSTFCIGK